MSPRKTGILQQKERAYLAEEFIYPADDLDFEIGDSGGRSAKSRIKTEVTTIEDFSSAIRTIRADLWAIHLFKRLESQESQDDWLNIILPAVKPDMERLRDQLDTMIDTAESTEFWEDRRSLREALGYLRHGLGESQNSPDGPEIQPADYKEYKRRRAALYRILSRPGLTDILEYLHERDRSYLPKQETTDGGHSWRKAATEVFVKELRIAKEERGNKYQLNERGMAVAKAWIALKECDTMATYSDDHSQINMQKITRQLLDRYFNAEQWADIDLTDCD